MFQNILISKYYKCKRGRYPILWGSRNKCLCELYGTNQLSLNKSFPSVIDAIKTRNKWRHQKIIIRLNHIVSAPKDVDFWPMIYEFYSEKYPEICRLIMLKMIIPLTTVRGFLALNFIKNEYRSRLGII